MDELLNRKRRVPSHTPPREVSFEGNDGGLLSGDGTREEVVPLQYTHPVSGFRVVMNMAHLFFLLSVSPSAFDSFFLASLNAINILRRVVVEGEALREVTSEVATEEKGGAYDHFFASILQPLSFSMTDVTTSS